MNLHYATFLDGHQATFPPIVVSSLSEALAIIDEESRAAAIRHHTPHRLTWRSSGTRATLEVHHNRNLETWWVDNEKGRKNPFRDYYRTHIRPR